MKRPVIAAVVAVVIIGAAAYAIFGGKNDSTDETQPSNSSSQNSNTDNSSNSQNSNAAQQTDKVSISNFAFSPATIQVKKGTVVTWTNNDSVAHTVTADSGTGPNSDQLAPGKTYSFTYNSTGTFNYHCSNHPEMHGTVTVTE